mgnify:CR=1 FL=1
MTVSNEDKVKEALNIIETASVKLEAHGFIDYDCDYLIFALNKFRKEFEFVTERDKRWNAEEENNKAYNYAMKIIDEEEERWQIEN